MASFDSCWRKRGSPRASCGKNTPIQQMARATEIPVEAVCKSRLTGDLPRLAFRFSLKPGQEGKVRRNGGEHRRSGGSPVDLRASNYSWQQMLLIAMGPPPLVLQAARQAHREDPHLTSPASGGKRGGGRGRVDVKQAVDPGSPLWWRELVPARMYGHRRVAMIATWTAQRRRRKSSTDCADRCVWMPANVLTDQPSACAPLLSPQASPFLSFQVPP